MKHYFKIPQIIDNQEVINNSSQEIITDKKDESIFTRREIGKSIPENTPNILNSNIENIKEKQSEQLLTYDFLKSKPYQHLL